MALTPSSSPFPPPGLTATLLSALRRRKQGLQQKHRHPKRLEVETTQVGTQQQQKERDRKNALPSTFSSSHRLSHPLPPSPPSSLPSPGPAPRRVFKNAQPFPLSPLSSERTGRHAEPDGPGVSHGKRREEGREGGRKGRREGGTGKSAHLMLVFSLPANIIATNAACSWRYAVGIT
jgi:hypothetical protein